jgi:flagellar biosynthesis chaperone FliJ
MAPPGWQMKSSAENGYKPILARQKKHAVRAEAIREKESMDSCRV